MKKVLILGQVPKEYGGNYTTGVANVIMELALPLTKEYQVYLYGTNLKSGRGRPLDKITFLGYSKKEIIKGMLRKLLLSPLGFFRELSNYSKGYGLPATRFMAYRILINKAVKDINPDIINAHGMIFAPVLGQLNLQERAIFSFHGFMYDDPASILANKKRGIDMEKLYTQGAKLVHKAIYLTPAMKKKGEDVLGIPSDHNTIISNGVDIGKFRFSKSERLRIRQLYGLEENDLVFISVGALTLRKNHLGFIDYLKRNKIKCHYWIIGKAIGQEKETLKKIDALASESTTVAIRRIEYVPHNELYAYYSAADVYAHPSSSEGQALVALEALCAGLPLVVNEQIRDTIGLEDYFEQFIDYIDLDSGGLSNIPHPDRETLSESCRSKLSWQVAAEKYSGFFKEQMQD